MAKQLKPAGWAPVLNAALDRLVQMSEAREGLRDEYTHVFTGALTRDAIPLVLADMGNPAGTTGTYERLKALGVIEHDGSKGFKGPAEWLLRAGQIGQDDAIRVDSLVRRAGRSAKAKRIQGGVGSGGATDQVDDGQLVPGQKSVVRRGASDESPLERQLRTVRELEEERDHLRAERDDFKEEWEQARKHYGPLKEENTRLTSMVQVLLMGGEQAEMLRKAAQLGSPQR